ncbi:glycoside hydrolase family 28 protein [candidate division KSB1 bacterium]|nr:glycoside hydrolase family 28 protein [candidate division KSB1 bacterium]
MRKLPFILISLFANLSILHAAEMSGQFNVLDYGAVGDGVKLNTTAIQQAIDACAAAGTGEVWFPGGTYLSGTLVLKRNVTLHLTADAVLLGSTTLADYPELIPEFRSYTDNYTSRSLIYAEKQTNIAIIGKGTIDGQGHKFPPIRHPYKNRPYMIRMIECSHISLENVTIQNSPMWVQHYLACDHLDISGMTVLSREANFNNDGIDIDGCHHVNISGCYVDSEDDAIVLKSTSNRACENVSISNCTLTSLSNAIKCGTESNGGFKNIRVSDCHIFETWNSGIALAIVDGGIMDGVVISNMTMHNLNNPLYIRLGNRARPVLPDAPKPATGTVKNIIISNIIATNVGNYLPPSHAYRGFKPRFDAHVPVIVAGLPDCPVENVSLSNVIIQYAGGSEFIDPALPVPEAEQRYPEYAMFGQVPASSVFCRHVKNLTLSNIKTYFLQPDHRFPIYCEDADGLVLHAFQTTGKTPDGKVQFLKDCQRLNE